MKKLIPSLIPLLAVVAFAAMPALAQAETKAYGTCATGAPETKPPCKVGEKFTAFPNGEVVPVVSKNKAGVVFVLENVANTAGFECSSLRDEGIFENTLGVGSSTLALIFHKCKGSGSFVGCVPNRDGIIVGEVDDQVLTMGTVEIKIVVGFNIRCGTTNLGAVSGTAVGAQGGSVLTFTSATGLHFHSEEATITGSDETETESTGKPVFIN